VLKRAILKRVYKNTEFNLNLESVEKWQKGHLKNINRKGKYSTSIPNSESFLSETFLR
jgi:hypothetical protein